MAHHHEGKDECEAETGPIAQGTVGEVSQLTERQRQGGDEDGHPWGGDAAKRGRLCVVDVELGQTDGRENGQQKRQAGQQIQARQNDFGMLRAAHQPVHDETRRHTERDHIRQRVQVGADGGVGVKQSGKKAIQEVEQPGHEDHQGRRYGSPRSNEKDGDAARKQVAAGDGVGDMAFEAHGDGLCELQR